MKRIVLGLIFALLWVGNAYAECIQGNCENGQGTYISPSGHTYAGEWKDGEPHGQGTGTWPNEDKYVGEWKKGKKNGQGTYTSTDGRNYVGEWKNDKREGQGKYIEKDGRKYVGEWKDGKYVGECTSENCVNGYGVFKWINGDKYAGEWKDGKKHGQGTMIWPNGDKYVGEWKDGKKHGQGTFTDVSEDKYVGEWKNGKRDGQGTATRANGYKYVGQWKDGIQYDQAAEILSIEKAKDDKIKEEKLLEKYNLFLDIEYADKKGFEILKKLLLEMGKCSYGAAILEAKVNLHSGVSRDIDKWIARADNAIYSNNVREMRITHGWLRRLAHEAFSSVATSYGVDNPTARFCKSLDINYEFKSTEFAVWKNKTQNFFTK